MSQSQCAKAMEDLEREISTLDASIKACKQPSRRQQFRVRLNRAIQKLKSTARLCANVTHTPPASPGSAPVSARNVDLADSGSGIVTTISSPGTPLSAAGAPMSKTSSPQIPDTGFTPDSIRNITNDIMKAYKGAGRKKICAELAKKITEVENSLKQVETVIPTMCEGITEQPALLACQHL